MLTQEQVLALLIEFNNQKGEYKAVNPILIENWFKQYLTTNS